MVGMGVVQFFSQQKKIQKQKKELSVHQTKQLTFHKKTCAQHHKTCTGCTKTTRLQLSKCHLGPLLWTSRFWTQYILFCSQSKTTREKTEGKTNTSLHYLAAWNGPSSLPSQPSSSYFHCSCCCVANTWRTILLVPRSTRIKRRTGGTWEWPTKRWTTIQSLK